jgi:hypothetical protein
MDFNFWPSALASKIRVAFEKAKREMSDNFCGVEIRFHQSYYQNMAQLEKDDEKICIICYEDLELDDSFDIFKAPSSVEIFNIPPSVGKHQVVDAMKERNLPMPSEFSYYELIGKFEGPMRAYAKYATVKEAQYVVETLKSNALEVWGSILEFKPMAKKTLDTHVPIRTPCGHIFGGHCLNTWIEGGQKPKEQPTCPYCRDPLLPKWKASPEYTKVRKEMLDKIGEGQWYKKSSPEEFLFRLNALRWHPIYYEQFIPLFTETLITLHTNNLADDTLQALDRSLLIIEAVARFNGAGLDDLGEARRQMVKYLELDTRHLELKNCVEVQRRGGYDWNPGEVQQIRKFAQELLLDTAYKYDLVTDGRYNDLDATIDRFEFWDNNTLSYRIENYVISDRRWFSECVSVVDALKHRKERDNQWLMDRAKILNEERKKYSIQLKVSQLKASKLYGNPKLYLEDVKHRVETLEKYHEKLAEVCSEVDALENGKGKEQKANEQEAKRLNKERKEQKANEQKAKRQKANKRKANKRLGV